MRRRLDFFLWRRVWVVVDLEWPVLVLVGTKFFHEQPAASAKAGWKSTSCLQAGVLLALIESIKRLFDSLGLIDSQYSCTSGAGASG